VLLVRIVYLLQVVYNVLFSSLFSTPSHCSASYAIVKQKLNVIYIILIDIGVCFYKFSVLCFFSILCFALCCPGT